MALQLMVTVGSSAAFLKECISRAGFTWNAHPLLLDAIMGWGKRQRQVAGEGSEEEEKGGLGRALNREAEM